MHKRLKLNSYHNLITKHNVVISTTVEKCDKFLTNNVQGNVQNVSSSKLLL